MFAKSDNDKAIWKIALFILFVMILPMVLNELTMMIDFAPLTKIANSLGKLWESNYLFLILNAAIAILIILEIISKGIKHKFSRVWLVYTILIGSFAAMIVFSSYEFSKSLIVSPIITSLILLFLLIKGRKKLNRKWKMVIIVAGLFLIMNSYLKGFQSGKVWASTITMVIHSATSVAVYKQFLKNSDYFFKWVDDLSNLFVT